MKREFRSHGSALGSTLLLALFLFLFSLTLVNLATFDLRTVTRNGQKQLAFNAAEAGLETVIAKLSGDPTVGLNDEVFTEVLVDGSAFRVSFDSSDSGPRSVNNLAELVGKAGYNGRAVPPLHASLFSTGTSPNGETSLVECVIRLEAIPYAVAGTGRVNLSTVTVLGANRLSQAGPASNLAGHVYSGLPGAGSLTVGGLSRVSGDARSVGNISVSPLASVLGDTDPNRSPDILPNLNIASFRNDTVPGVTLHPAGSLPPPVLTGQHYFDGDVSTLLPIVMNDATIYVNGNFTLPAVAGTGTIFVDGETRFLAAVTLAGNDRLTLFSEGNISFLLPSVIQGVLYTHGNINTGPLLSLTVLGAVYAVADGDPSRGNINIGTGSLVVHVSEMTAFASSFLGRNGDANVVRVYWNKLR